MTVVGENEEVSFSAIRQTKDLGLFMIADHKWSEQCNVVARKPRGARHVRVLSILQEADCV